MCEHHIHIHTYSAPTLAYFNSGDPRLIFSWQPFRRRFWTRLWTWWITCRKILGHVEGPSSGDPHLVWLLEDVCALQVRAFGWPEAIPDVDQHVGLLSLWHGTDLHVPVHDPAVSARYIGDLAWGTGAGWPEVGKMTVDYLLPPSNPSTRQVADIIYLKKKCRIARLRHTSLDLFKRRGIGRDVFYIETIFRDPDRQG